VKKSRGNSVRVRQQRRREDGFDTSIRPNQQAITNRNLRWIQKRRCRDEAQTTMALSTVQIFIRKGMSQSTGHI